MNPAPMERLGFELHEFTRMGWTSDQASEVWSPRIRRIAAAWKKIEILAVVQEARSCALALVNEEDLVRRSSEWLSLGLVGCPLTMSSAPQGSPSNAQASIAGRPLRHRVAVGRPSEIQSFKSAFDQSDHRTIGQLLGYPTCCCASFERVWKDWRLTNSTWPMALATEGVEHGERSLTVAPFPASNILWRWLGVRIVPHLPCCFRCTETERLGSTLLQIGKAAGFNAEMGWLAEILRWPAEWSSLHGIAEVKTPVLRVSARTDATSVKYVVRLKGTLYPTEGARGVRFPYSGVLS